MVKIRPCAVDRLRCNDCDLQPPRISFDIFFAKINRRSQQIASKLSNALRSEERRVGKECRSGWSRYLCISKRNECNGTCDGEVYSDQYIEVYSCDIHL